MRELKMQRRKGKLKSIEEYNTILDCKLVSTQGQNLRGVWG